MKPIFHIVVWRPRGSKTWTPVDDRLFTYYRSAFVHAAELSKQTWNQAHPNYAGKTDGVEREYNVATVSILDKNAVCFSRNANKTT